MLVTDMGNNRVSIFRKYKIDNKFYRFRFYRFLNDTSETISKIKSPLSITVNENSGIVYVLNGNSIKQNIVSFKPTLKDKHLIYEYKKDILLDFKGTKIRIDDRGLIAVTDIDNKVVKLLTNKKDLDLESE